MVPASLGALAYTSLNSLGWVLADRSRAVYGIPLAMSPATAAWFSALYPERRVRFINRETGTIDFELEIIPKTQYIASHRKKKIKEGIDYVYVISTNQSYEEYAANVALVE